MSDPYVEKLLVLSRGDPKLLKKAYRALALKVHPDAAGPRGNEAFRRIKAAYDEAAAILAAGKDEASPAEPERKKKSPKAPKDFDGVEYWKIKSPEERYAFHLEELDEWVRRVPADPTWWGRLEYLLPADKPWRKHLDRFFQVIPLLPEDGRLVASIGRFVEFLDTAYAVYPNDPATETAAKILLDALSVFLEAAGRKGRGERFFPETKEASRARLASLRPAPPADASFRAFRVRVLQLLETLDFPEKG